MEHIFSFYSQSKKIKNKTGFTLAEIMIVLTIIGIITAIMVPMAYNALPNRKVMKFKKAHNTLVNVIKGLTSSNKYYLNGDLGIKQDGTFVTSNNVDSAKYFCQSLAETLSVKTVNCTSGDTGGKKYFTTNGLYIVGTNTQEQRDSSSIGDLLDTNCMHAAVSGSQKRNEIILSDGTTFYTGNPSIAFGDTSTSGERIFLKTWDGVGNSCYPTLTSYSSSNCSYGHMETTGGMAGSGRPGFLYRYKSVCIDIDGIPDNATASNCKNECPFGYGIRTDGNIILGTRAKEWLDKKI